MQNPEVRQQIGLRLLEERTPLGFTQQALADAISAPRVSFVKYEASQSSPAAETPVALEGAGVDVCYVLTRLRQAPNGVDRERFRRACLAVDRQARSNRDTLSTGELLSLVWRIVDAYCSAEAHRARHDARRVTPEPTPHAHQEI